MRYRLRLAYDGTDFHGWQKQHPPDAEPLRTVQGVVEDTVRAVVREDVELVGASRTDSGVHARGQVAAFSVTEPRVPVDRLVPALNARLPDDVLVVHAMLTHDAFNPIGDAESKGYRYVIAHGVVPPGTPGHASRPLFDRRFVTYSAMPLDVDRMDAAAQHLVGGHDFASLTRLHHGRESTVREIHACRVVAQASDRVAIDVSGSGFLYNMVRIIAGTLLDVGVGRREPEDVPGILAARDRSAAGATLPPEGLCLMWIRYPGDAAATE